MIRQKFDMVDKKLSALEIRQVEHSWVCTFIEDTKWSIWCIQTRMAESVGHRQRIMWYCRFSLNSQDNKMAKSGLAKHVDHFCLWNCFRYLPWLTILRCNKLFSYEGKQLLRQCVMVIVIKHFSSKRAFWIIHFTSLC